MVELLNHKVTREDRADGTVILRSGLELGPVARTTGAWLDDWAAKTPDAVFLAERSGDGWREASYAEMRQSARAVAASLIERGIGPGDFITALSGPGVDHGVLMLAAQYVGAAIVPLAEQYSLIPDARHRLVHALKMAPPKMVFAVDAGPYGAALAIPELEGVEKVASRTEGAPVAVTPFADLLKGSGEAGVEAAHQALTKDTVAKLLFTSGSTSMPKGVPQTQGMLTVNQAQYQSCLPFFAERPHRILDWLPWNHVFAGNSDFYMALSNGAALYLDDGKPLKGLYDRTIENIKTRAGTMSFNVPVAYIMLVEAMRADVKLREAFFADLDMIFYAGASLPADVWKGLEEMAMEVKGEVPLMTSSWGMTETAPSCLLGYQAGQTSGNIGVPVPGLEEKLIPLGGDRFELRVRGPQVMDGYYNDPKKTAESFDEEGFLITGDAVKFVDPADDAAGVFFDGRVTEDFKLLTGTWVQAGNLRLEALKNLKGLAQDLVVTGADKMQIGLLIFPTPDAAGKAADGGAIIDAEMLADLETRLKAMAANATGSSNRIARALIMAEPPSVKDAEITAKGSINIKAVLSGRADLLERLYDDADPAAVKA